MKKLTSGENMDTEEQQEDGLSPEVDLSKIAVPLSYEITDSVAMVKAGIEMWCKDGVNATGPASLLYATGIEKLMKIALVFYSRSSGVRLTRRRIEKTLSHDLERIFDEISRQQLWFQSLGSAEYGIISEDPDTNADMRALLEVLRHCSGRDRYKNLNAIIRPGETLDNPESAMAELHGKWTVDYNPDWMSQGIDASNEATHFAMKRMVAGLRRWVRAVCRIFTLGPHPEESKCFLGLFTGFLYLRDSDLGKNVQWYAPENGTAL